MPRAPGAATAFATASAAAAAAGVRGVDWGWEARASDGSARQAGANELAFASSAAAAWEAWGRERDAASVGGGVGTLQPWAGDGTPPPWAGNGTKLCY